MLINEYSAFVLLSDETQAKSIDDRKRIARYGIASEIGSLVSAIKKKELTDSAEHWNKANDEICEELGDIVWYTVMLSLLNGDSALKLLQSDLYSLTLDIKKDKIFKQSLDQDKYKQFVREADEFIASNQPLSFDEYQKISILTSRTSGRDLLHVCLTRLLLYATVMMSHGFPQVEKLMQTDIVKLDVRRCLGMLMWHIAALADVMGLSLNDVVSKNRNKLNDLANFDGEGPTPLHDDDVRVPDSQRLPREFEVSFISIDEGKLQMFYEGRPLGNELTDNSLEDDGYRFHDCLHLANAAKLGWSPVLRELMKRKRKYDPKIDSSEDGARARIVEEAVVKAVHSEGAKASGTGVGSNTYLPTSLFTSKDQISFAFLKLIRRFVRKLEVEKNKYWEWQEAIVEGHKIYAALCKEKQGTVRVNIQKRSIEFDRRVSPRVVGPVASIGAASGTFVGGRARNDVVADMRKAAILKALDFEEDDWPRLDELRIELFGDSISVKADGDIQKRIWDRKIVEFRQIETEIGGLFICNVLALTW